MVSRVDRAIEILEALHEYLKEGTPLYPGALILDDNMTLQEAVAECLGEDK